MEEDKAHVELQLSCILGEEANGANPDVPPAAGGSLLIVSSLRRFSWWLRVAVYISLVIAGQSVATSLARIYFDNGGKSKWLATLVQLAGFPLFLPYYLIPRNKNNPTTKISNTVPLQPKQPCSTTTIALYYVSLGLLVALDGFLYTVGLSHLPVSTYSLICASQLAFNAFFSFLFNSQKFTPYIVNALVLLTIASILLVFQQDSSSLDEPTKASKTKYAIGFICTAVASAVYGLVLSLTELFFKRVVRRETFRVVMDMIVFQSLFATLATLMGLFVSGEWKDLEGEMEGFESVRVSYLMNLVWTAITWQLFSVGSLGLTWEASSLFSNAVSVLGLPVVVIVAVIFFHDKMDGIKAIAMALSMWGFFSFVYHHSVDDRKSKLEDNVVVSKD